MKLNGQALLIIGTIVIGLAVILILAALQPSEKEELQIWAEELGMDGEQFIADYESEEIRAEVAAEKAEGTSRGVSATPTLFMNGQQVPLPGQDYSALRNTALPFIQNASVNEPVLVEVYEDYLCPFCAQFFALTYQLEYEFGDLVDVRRLYYPLNEERDSNRWTYAYAAEAAERQGYFFAMSRRIFEEEHNNLDYSVLDTLTISPNGDVTPSEPVQFPVSAPIEAESAGE